MNEQGKKPRAIGRAAGWFASRRMPVVALAPGLLLAGLGACTSIQWEDASGRTHHLGLVAMREETGERGNRVDRYALGLDLRLSGSAAGVTLGWNRLQSTEPRTITPASCQEFLDSVVAHLQGEEPPAPPRAVRWRAFYFTEDVSADETLHVEDTLGLDLRVAGSSAGLTLGYHGARSLAGRALDDDVALIASERAEDPDAGEVHLWVLPVGRAIHEGGDEP